MSETVTERLKRLHNWCDDCGRRIQGDYCKHCREIELAEAEKN